MGKFVFFCKCSRTAFHSFSAEKCFIRKKGLATEVLLLISASVSDFSPSILLVSNLCFENHVSLRNKLTTTFLSVTKFCFSKNYFILNRNYTFYTIENKPFKMERNFGELSHPLSSRTVLGNLQNVVGFILVIKFTFVLFYYKKNTFSLFCEIYFFSKERMHDFAVIGLFCESF